MSFLDRIFKGKKRGAVDLVADTLEGIIEKADFQLSFDMGEKDNTITIDFFGEDENLLTQKNGQLLDSLQMFLIRIIQHKQFEDRYYVVANVGSFREDFEANLMKQAEKLKKAVLSKNKPAYFDPLSAKNRRLIHQFFSEDKEVEAISIGNSDYKKIKLVIKGSKRPDARRPDARKNTKKPFNKKEPVENRENREDKEDKEEEVNYNTLEHNVDSQSEANYNK
ncbi:MAG: hypothetical protein HAW63_00300 [Bdellovibrionaceae bacterium]|nr:hypothetical protein [Pseudobdellovibrionaceae bacterium]